MDDRDPIRRLASRLGPTGDEGLVGLVEQLVHAKELIAENQISTLRLAVILVDHLAEVLLYHYTERLIARGDDFLHPRHRPFTGSERQRLRRAFDEKVQAALSSAGISSDAPAILTPRNGAILSVAHHYRNAIYHRDTHNPGFLPQLARLQFVAVTETFAGSFNRNLIASITGRARDYRARLGQLGFHLDVESNSFTPWEIAEACAAELVSGVTLDAGEVKAVLAADVAGRLALRDEVIRVLEEDGMRHHDIVIMVRAAEANDTHGEDPELLRLRSALSELWAAEAGSSGEDDSFPERHFQLLEQQEKRIDELLKTFKSTVFDEGERFLASLKRHFEDATDLQEILEAYRDLDEYLRRVEGYLLSVVNEWDRLVQREIDRRLGR